MAELGYRQVSLPGHPRRAPGPIAVLLLTEEDAGLCRKAACLLLSLNGLGFLFVLFCAGVLCKAFLSFYFSFPAGV